MNIGIYPDILQWLETTRKPEYRKYLKSFLRQTSKDITAKLHAQQRATDSNISRKLQTEWKLLMPLGISGGLSDSALLLGKGATSALHAS